MDKLKTIDETAIAARMDSPLVKDVSDGRIGQAVTMAFLRAGQDKEDNILEFLISDFKKSVVEEFPYLTVEEVSYALKEGVFGRYGEYFGVNEVTMMNWVRAYVVSDERINFIQKRNIDNAVKALPPKKEPTEEEKREEVLKFIQKEIDTYKRIHRYSSIGTFVYDYLDKAGVIQTSNAEKWELYNKYYKLEMELERTCPQKTGAIVAFSERMKLIEKNVKRRATKRCKDFLVVRFFDSVIASGKDVQTFIDDNQKN